MSLAFSTTILLDINTKIDKNKALLLNLEKEYKKNNNNDNDKNNNNDEHIKSMVLLFDKITELERQKVAFENNIKRFNIAAENQIHLPTLTSSSTTVTKSDVDNHEFNIILHELSSMAMQDQSSITDQSSIADLSDLSSITDQSSMKDGKEDTTSNSSQSINVGLLDIELANKEYSGLPIVETSMNRFDKLKQVNQIKSCRSKTSDQDTIKCIEGCLGFNKSTFIYLMGDGGYKYNLEANETSGPCINNCSILTGKPYSEGYVQSFYKPSEAHENGNTLKGPVIFKIQKHINTKFECFCCYEAFASKIDVFDNSDTYLGSIIRNSDFNYRQSTLNIVDSQGIINAENNAHYSYSNIRRIGIEHGYKDEWYESDIYEGNNQLRDGKFIQKYHTFKTIKGNVDVISSSVTVKLPHNATPIDKVLFIAASISSNLMN